MPRILSSGRFLHGPEMMGTPGMRSAQLAVSPAPTLPPGLAACRAILGGESDPFAHEWDSLAESERTFWLSAARLNRFDARKPWRDLTGDTRCRIKNALYRAAQRAKLLLAAGVPA